jgi:hypothetical protein
MKYEVIKFYSDTKAGTIGECVKSWREPNGTKWVKLYFGKNLSGQNLYKYYPESVIKRSQL